MARLKKLRVWAYTQTDVHVLMHTHTFINIYIHIIVACVCVYVRAHMRVYIQETGCNVVHVLYVDCNDTGLCNAGWEFLCCGDVTLLFSSLMPQNTLV